MPKGECRRSTFLFCFSQTEAAECISCALRQTQAAGHIIIQMTSSFNPFQSPANYNDSVDMSSDESSSESSDDDERSYLEHSTEQTDPIARVGSRKYHLIRHPMGYVTITSHEEIQYMQQCMGLIRESESHSKAAEYTTFQDALWALRTFFPNEVDPLFRQYQNVVNRL
jgi:hypothetical protein